MVATRQKKTPPVAQPPAAPASDDDNDHDEEEEIIRLPEEPAASTTNTNKKKKNPTHPPPLPPQQKKLLQESSRLGSMRLETGLASPSYFRFHKVGKAKTVTLDPQAKPVQAQLTKANLLQSKAANSTASASRPTPTHPQKGRGGAASTTSVYEKDKEREQDAKMLLMRNYIDPKRFYKSLESLAPGFQIGTVIEGRTDAINNRLTRRQRKRTFVDEILADRGVRSYSKRKFTEIQAQHKSGKKGWLKAKQRKRGGGGGGGRVKK